MTVPEPVALTAHDGTVLRGQVWPGGADWAVLVHDVGEDADLDRWRPLLPSLLAQDLTVLAMDLRGHGASGGVWDAARGAADIHGAVAHAWERGAAFVALLAAGASAPDALRVAADATPDALVLLSPTGVAAETADGLRGAGEAKLLVVGAADLGRRHATDILRRAAIGWTATVSFPTLAQGTDLLTGPWAGHLAEQIHHFLAECRFLAHHTRERAGTTERVGTPSRADERGAT